ncbi:MAG: DUF3107 domain-containing protein [Actinomycetota bacterium]|nr:DUF3107 domain-containing protein [Actinomycetota bacterium]
MDVRIGVTYSSKELDIELEEDTDGEALRSSVDEALAGKSPTLWLSDRSGRQIGVPADKIAFVEIGRPEGDRRIGFGSS